MFVKDTVRLKAEFRDFDGNLVSPDDVSLVIYDINYEIIEEIENITPVETGKYEYDYVLEDGATFFKFEGELDGNPVGERGVISEDWLNRQAYIAFIQQECNNTFKDDDGKIKLPSDIQHILLPYLLNNHNKDDNVTSKSASDLSISFESSDMPKKMQRIIRNHRKVGFK